MITFEKNRKQMNIPKGLGNIAVSVQSGATDVVSNDTLAAALAENSRQDRTYASQVANSAATEAIQTAEDYTDSAVASGVTTAEEYADSAITAADYCIYLSGYTQYWDTQVGTINAFIDRMKAIWTAKGGSKIAALPLIQRYRVFIGVGGMGAVAEFHVYNYDGGNSIDLTAMGKIYGLNNGAISVMSITLQKDRQPEQGDMEIKTLQYSS